MVSDERLTEAHFLSATGNQVAHIMGISCNVPYRWVIGVRKVSMESIKKGADNLGIPESEFRRYVIKWINERKRTRQLRSEVNNVIAELD